MSTRLDKNLAYNYAEIINTSSEEMSERQQIGSISPDAQYIEQLYSLYSGYVFKYLKSKYGAESLDLEDITQEAFEKVASLENPQTIKNPRAYILAIARNQVIDRFRKEKIRLAYQKSTLILGDQEISDDFSPENVLLGKQKISVLKKTVKSLPEIQQSILYHRKIEGMTNTQIAEKMGVSETTVRKYVEQAVEQIHIALKVALGESV